MLLRVALLCHASLAANGCRTRGEPEGGTGATPVKLATLESADVAESDEYIATLRSRRSITLLPQVDGQITKIFVSAGDRVTPGSVLMQIDPARQEATVRSQDAGRAARRANLEYWTQQASRLQALYDGGAASRQELEQAKSALTSAQADVDALGASVRAQEVLLQYHRVTAPVGGVVGDIPVRVGDRVTPATALTTIDNGQMLEAYIAIPAERGDALRPGLAVQIADADGAALAETQLSFVAPNVSDETQSILAKAMVSNEKGLLRVGQFVRARVMWGAHKGVTIPITAVLRMNGQYFAYVVEGNGKNLVAKQRALDLGDLREGAYVVRAGLKAGDRVVVSGVQNIKDGSALEPQA